MTIAELILLTLKASICAFVFALGLKSSRSDIFSLVRQPSLLIRTLLSMNVIMPLFAAAMISIFTFRPSVMIALMALSLSPVPPLLPNKQVKARGNRSYAIGLFVVVSLIAIVWIPLAVEVLGSIFGRPLGVPPAAIAKIVATLILGPLLLGILVRTIATALADRVAPILSTVATITLLAAAALILFSTWREVIAQIGNGTILALAAFIIVGLVAGHLLGGPDPDERTDLALATASRHPGITLAIATITFPAAHDVKALVALYLVLNVLISLPYVRWRAKADVAVSRPPQGLASDVLSGQGRR